MCFILHVNVPELNIEFDKVPNKALCDGSHTHLKVQGLDENGTFITAPLKQYRPPLCGVLARAAHSNLAKKLPSKSVDWNDFALSGQVDFYVPLDPYYEGHQWGRYGNDNAASASNVSCQLCDPYDVLDPLAYTAQHNVPTGTLVTLDDHQLNDRAS